MAAFLNFLGAMYSTGVAKTIGADIVKSALHGQFVLGPVDADGLDEAETVQAGHDMPARAAALLYPVRHCQSDAG